MARRWEGTPLPGVPGPIRCAWFVPVLALAATAGCGGAYDDDPPGAARATAGSTAHERAVVRHSIRPRGHRLGVPADHELAAR